MKVISLSIPRNNKTGHEAINITLLEGTVTTPLSVTNDHPSWNKARSLVDDFQAGEITNEELAEALTNALNLEKSIEDKFHKVGGILDGRMMIKNRKITVDYEPVDEVLEAHILRMIDADGTPNDTRNWTAFSRFIENLYSNTSEFVRQQLFSWMSYESLNNHGLTLTDDGCFVGYKGLMGTVEEALSRHTGTAIVDGVTYTGHIPNPIGGTVEMPRNKVEDDPKVGCAPGLHVGTWDYAKGWAQGVLVTVKVNPRDVVSVPTECDAQKIRVCRYEVIEAVEVAYEAPTFDSHDYADTTTFEWGVDFEGFPEVLENVKDETSFLISYTDSHGNVTEREVTPHEVSAYYLEGISEDKGEFRTFLISGINSAEPIVRDEDDSDEELDSAEDESKHSTLEGYVREAIRAHDDLEVTYVDSRGRRTVRVVTPESIKMESPSLVAYCHASDGFRTFLFSGIESVKFADAFETVDLDPEAEEEILRNGYAGEGWK